MRLNWGMFKKLSLLFLVIVLFASALGLLLVLDFFNLESLEHFNNGGFYFDYSWKGRMFLALFLFIFVIEYITSRGLKQAGASENKLWRYLRVLAVIVFASIPLIHIVGTNFLGFDQVVVGAADAIRGDFWRANYKDWANFLGGDWPLSIEYLVFTISAIFAVFFAYGRAGLKAFSISIAFVGGIAIIFLMDTMFPYGALRFLQVLTLPTSACATAMLELLGFKTFMTYGPLDTGPKIFIYPNETPAGATVNWPCAGIHSLFLFVLIMILLLRRSDVSSFRKTVYFFFGLAVTYFVNVLRIVVYFLILAGDGQEAAAIYHRDYGELLFLTWIGVYIIWIVSIEKFKLIERLQQRSHLVLHHE